MDASTVIFEAVQKFFFHIIFKETVVKLRTPEGVKTQPCRISAGLFCFGEKRGMFQKRKEAEF